MKLLKKLLPLAIVGTTAAAITPFVASCGNKDKYTASWTYRDGIFVYTTEKHAKAEATNAQATQWYFEAVEDNPLIFAEDVTQKMSYYERMGVEDQTLPMIPLTAKTSVQSVAYDAGLGFVTFSVDFTGLMGTYYPIAEEPYYELVFDTYGEGHLEVNNVAFSIQYRQDLSTAYENYWDPDCRSADQEDWSVVLDMTMPSLGRTEYSIFTNNDSELWQEAGLALAYAVSPDYCYYLNDVSHAEEP